MIFLREPCSSTRTGSFRRTWTSGSLILPDGSSPCQGAMVGLYPTVAGTWIEEAVNFRLRTPSGRSGFVVEAASGSEGRPFAEFQASLKKRTPRVAIENTTPSVRFVTADGRTMEFRWDGTRTLDGKPHSFAGYGLYRGPFVERKGGEWDRHVDRGRENQGARFHQGCGVGAMTDRRCGYRMDRCGSSAPHLLSMRLRGGPGDAAGRTANVCGGLPRPWLRCGEQPRDLRRVRPPQASTRHGRS